MAFIFHSTAGAAAANSYLLVADADDLLAGLLEDGGWSAATTLEKQQALAMAATCIDGQPLTGAKYDPDVTDGVPDQALHFPTGDNCYTDENGDTVLFIPDLVEQAAAHQAVAILRAYKQGDLLGAHGRAQLQREGVQTFSIGGVAETFRPGVFDPRVKLCPEAARLLRGYVRKASRLVR
jgi:hypothetical protein